MRVAVVLGMVMLAGCGAAVPLTPVTGSEALNEREATIAAWNGSSCMPDRRPPFSDPDQWSTTCRCLKDGTAKYISRTEMREFQSVMKNQSGGAAMLLPSYRKYTTIRSMCETAYDRGDHSGVFASSTKQ